MARECAARRSLRINARELNHFCITSESESKPIQFKVLIKAPVRVEYTVSNVAFRMAARRKLFGIPLPR